MSRIGLLSTISEGPIPLPKHIFVQVLATVETKGPTVIKYRGLLYGLKDISYDASIQHDLRWAQVEAHCNPDSPCSTLTTPSGCFVAFNVVLGKGGYIKEGSSLPCSPLHPVRQREMRASSDGTGITGSLKKSKWRHRTTRLKRKTWPPLEEPAGKVRRVMSEVTKNALKCAKKERGRVLRGKGKRVSFML